MKKIVLIGAGSAQFGVGTLNDIFNSECLGQVDITLLDINGDALDKVYRAGLEWMEKKGLNHKLTATTDRPEALKGADFVISSIEVGDRFALWDQDWKIPKQYGIRQVYGENGGPGGIFHSLRIIPVILDICADIMKFCPEAFVFNYSNPMSAIVTTVKRQFPSCKFIGLCHEISSLERYLPTILGTPFDNLELTAAGLNHFSMVLEAKYKDSGQDAYPDILDKAPAFFEKEPGFTDIWAYVKRTGDDIQTEGAKERFELDVQESRIPWADRTLFKYLLETYKLLPITSDSHLGEYIGWAWERADHRGIEDFYEFYRDALSDVMPHFGQPTHERVIPIIEGIVADLGYVEGAVNILNREPGASEESRCVADLPDWIALEVPALVNKEGVRGRNVTIPKDFCALLRNYVSVYDLTAEAIITGRKDYVVKALLANPVVNSSLRLDELVDQMIETQSPWLDYLK
ncbi:MAG: alpha-glucosidase [Spirochaetales bacterium]|nr:alpha-glucosidase [Spirochaetales bacterium]